MTAPGPDRLLVTETILNDALAGTAEASHTHPATDVTGLDGALNGKASTSHTHTWASVTGKPATFPTETHSHTTAQVTGLDTALTGKAPLSHAHTTSHVNGLDTALSQRILKAGTATTVWSGSQSAYDALAPATRNAAGFIAVIT